MYRIWRSSLSTEFKLRLFASTVESVLLYGCEAWTLDDNLAKKIDGCYTRLLRAVLGYSWKDKITNEMLYGEIPKVTDKIRTRRLRLAGHIQRHPEEAAHNLLFWNPLQARRKRGRPTRTYLQQLQDDTGLEAHELRTVMDDRYEWRIMIGRNVHTFRRE